MAGKVEICGVDTSKLPVIPESQLHSYFERIYAGDEEAKDEFIWGNLRLVLSIVQRFSGRAESMDDLFQVGCVGLIKAVSNFDTSMNVRFSTYACPMIIGEIRRYLRDNNSIRVSRSLRDTAYKRLSNTQRVVSKIRYRANCRTDCKTARNVRGRRAIRHGCCTRPYITLSARISGWRRRALRLGQHRGRAQL